MDSYHLQIITIITALVGGGAMGSIITAAVAWYRDRRQPVARHVDVMPILRGAIRDKLPSTKVHLDDRAEERDLRNLFLAIIRIEHRGNKGLEEFSFWLRLSSGDVLVQISANGPNPACRPETRRMDCVSEPKGDAIVCCTPFERGQEYSVAVLIEVPEGQECAGPIDLYTAQLGVMFLPYHRGGDAPLLGSTE